jgi:hypothetical protein
MNPFNLRSLKVENVMMHLSAEEASGPSASPDTPPRRKASLSTHRLTIHDDAVVALTHAEALERMTGDRCEVVRYGVYYRVARTDASGKQV